jgi:hypothetical protein
VHGQLSVHGDLVTDMSNLSPAASADYETVSTLTKIITPLTEQRAHKYMFLKAKDVGIGCLTQGSTPGVVLATVTPNVT